jgi:hypothetical protein
VALLLQEPPDADHALLRERAEELDAAIERAVHALYGLRAGEIRIIEKS